MLSIQLTNSDIDEITKINSEMFFEYKNITPLYSLKSRLAADKIALLICSKDKIQLDKDFYDDGQHIVDNVISLFVTEMHLGITISEISSRLEINLSLLRKLFKKFREENPSSLLEKIRMNRAMKLISNKEYTIKMISQSCGFSKQSSFTKAFSRH